VLARRAKLLMMAQALASLVVAVLAARAVNTLGRSTLQQPRGGSAAPR
jgi:hypothetical protein